MLEEPQPLPTPPSPKTPLSPSDPTPPQPSVVRPNNEEPQGNSGSMPSLAPSDPGSMPPATGMNFSPGQVVGANFGVGTASPSVVPKKSKKRLWLAVAVVPILLLAAGYAFAFYLPNTPSRVYSSSLVNSGKALDALINYSKQQEHANYTSTSFDGEVHVKSPSGSYDVSLSGAADKNADANLQMKGDFVGEKIDANVRSVRVQGNSSPDVYVQVTGIKSFLDGLGLTKLGGLDGQWIVVDHTLIDTYASDLKQGVDSSASTNKIPTYAELQDAAAKAQAVNKQYLFTTDSSKAVLTNQKFLGKTTQNGRTLDHYQVGYNKAHLEAYVMALGAALDSSQLNKWSKAANSGKSLSKVMNFSSLETSVKNAKSDYTFDLWADTKTKLIGKLTFADASDKASWFTITQSYNGDSQYPFGLSFADSAKSNGGTADKGNVNLTLDTKTNKVSATFSGASGASSMNGNFTVTPGNSLVKVTTPKGAKSVTDILAQFGLGSLAAGNNSSGSSNVNPGGPAIFSQT